MKNYKENERKRQQTLIETSELFDGCCGGAKFFGKERAFVLKDGIHNLYAPIRKDVIKYFRENKIAWWSGYKPSGHVLSSQIACLNHLFSLRNNANAVLAILNNVRNEFVEVLRIPSDKEPSYIAFEVVSNSDHLKEGTQTRGSNCTSIDALIYARHKSGETWLIPIEWKYTELYNNTDKSHEDRKGETKGTNGKGKERMSRYNRLITASEQLKSLDRYAGCIYYYEPFYQLMRQTIWVENIKIHNESEKLVAKDFLHIHVIPSENDELLHKRYKVSGESMEISWRDMLKDQSKYIIVDPKVLLSPVATEYPELIEYLSARYWAK